MKILVAYQSKTGFTKKYAEWISNELNSELKEIKNVSSQDIVDNGLIIYGGWIMGGMIMGLNKIKKLNPKKIIVFAVGSTKKEEVNLDQIINTNNLSDIPFFYYQGGMNPKKLGFIYRTMVKMVTKEKPTYNDITNNEDIKELIKMVKNM